MGRPKAIWINRKKIEDRMKELNMSRQELADRIGMDYQSLSRCLRVKAMSKRMILEMAKVLDKTPDYLTAPSGSSLDSLPNRYGLHLFRENTITPEQIVDTVLRTVGYDPEKVKEDNALYWAVYYDITEAVRDRMYWYEHRETT